MTPGNRRPWAARAFDPQNAIFSFESRASPQLPQESERVLKPVVFIPAFPVARWRVFCSHAMCRISNNLSNLERTQTSRYRREQITEKRFTTFEMSFSGVRCKLIDIVWLARGRACS